MRLSDGCRPDVGLARMPQRDVDARVPQITEEPGQEGCMRAASSVGREPVWPSSAVGRSVSPLDPRTRTASIGPTDRWIEAIPMYGMAWLVAPPERAHREQTTSAG